jgi:hypothetical protein
MPGFELRYLSAVLSRFLELLETRQPDQDDLLAMRKDLTLAGQVLRTRCLGSQAAFSKLQVEHFLGPDATDVTPLEEFLRRSA